MPQVLKECEAARPDDFVSRYHQFGNRTTAAKLARAVLRAHHHDRRAVEFGAPHKNCGDAVSYLDTDSRHALKHPPPAT
jgi:hypothetical protein